jgi:hypothetical protein
LFAKIKVSHRFKPMSRPDQPAFLGSSAFWSFVSEQQDAPVVRRLEAQVGSHPSTRLPLGSESSAGCGAA